MKGLRSDVLAAHGCIDCWHNYRSAEASIVTNRRLFALPLLTQDPGVRRTTGWLNEYRASVTPFLAPDQCALVTPDCTAIKKRDGALVAPRFVARDFFADHQQNPACDPPHRVYFNGEAMSAYLTRPLLLTAEGMRVEGAESRQDETETWRVIRE